MRYCENPIGQWCQYLTHTPVPRRPFCLHKAMPLEEPAPEDMIQCLPECKRPMYIPGEVTLESSVDVAYTTLAGVSDDQLINMDFDAEAKALRVHDTWTARKAWHAAARFYLRRK